MKALILAAGYGTRLYPLVQNTAKPLLQFNKKPIVDYLLDKIKGFQGLNEILVITNEKFFADFNQWAKNKKDFTIPVKVLSDGTTSNEDRLGSIGDIDFVLTKTGISEDLLVVGGDNLFDYGLDGYFAFAQKNRPRVTIGLYDIRDIAQAKKFGVVKLDAQRKVASFEEKPASPKTSLIAMCLYYFPEESLVLIKKYIQETKKADAAGGYISWLCQKESVFGFTFQGKWFDIGSVESYQVAQKEFES